MEALRNQFTNLPKISQLGSGRARIKICLSREYRLVGRNWLQEALAIVW